MNFLKKYHLNFLKFIEIGLKFGLTGGVGFVINYSILRLLTGQYGYNKIWAEVIATIVALQVTFILNNYWTYSQLTTENELELSIPKRYVAYIASNTVGSLITIFAFWILSGPIKNDLLSLLVAAIFGMTWNFFSNLLVTWRPKRALQESYSEEID